MSGRTITDTIKVAATFAGTIIGAGFASGQELLTFFVVYGSMGLAGILLAGCLFSWLGSRIVELGHRTHAAGYHQLLYYVCGKKVGVVLDSIIGIFLFAVLAIMLAGAGTVSRESLQLPFGTGAGALALLLVATVLRGVSGITTANLIATPVLAIAIIGISVYSLSYHDFDTASLFLLPDKAAVRPAPHWIVASILYVSYNLVMGSTVLAPLGAATPQRKARLYGSIAGGMLLAFLAFLGSMAIMLHCPDIFDEEIPMLYISEAQHSLHGAVYTGIFVISMFTTALASLYGCATKIHAVTRLQYPVCVLLIIILALLCSHVGFSSLISLLFPLFGYGTLWFLFRLIFVK